MKSRDELVLVIELVFFIHFTMALIIIGVNTYVDPYGDLRAPWRKNIERNNPIQEKLQTMDEAKKVEVIIIGSTSSIGFFPDVLQKKLRKKVFSAATHNASLPEKFLYFRKAIQDLKKLKRVIFFVDLEDFILKPVNQKLLYTPDAQLYIYPEVRNYPENSFLHRVYDYLSIRTFFTSLSFEDSVITKRYTSNGAIKGQVLNRIMFRPDLFSYSDISFEDAPLLLFKKIKEESKQHGIKLDFVLLPKLESKQSEKVRKMVDFIWQLGEGTDIGIYDFITGAKAEVINPENWIENLYLRSGIVEKLTGKIKR
jgi:hypothetical protein